MRQQSRLWGARCLAGSLPRRGGMGLAVGTDDDDNLAIAWRGQNGEQLRYSS